MTVSTISPPHHYHDHDHHDFHHTHASTFTYMLPSSPRQSSGLFPSKNNSEQQNPADFLSTLRESFRSSAPNLSQQRLRTHSDARLDGHTMMEAEMRQRAGSNGAVGGPIHMGSLGHGQVPVPISMLGAGPPSSGARMGNGGRLPSFEGPRSPPNSKNTSHVPCKFFKQGQCQAGQACPFLHSEAINVCKYFQKGNCKFGMRCANEHITQDGRRVNKPALSSNAAAMQMSARGGMPMAMGSPSLLSMQHDAFARPQASPKFGPEEFMQPSSWKNRPLIETTNYNSYTGSAFGSPPNDSRLPMSPNLRGLSVMDVPLPASFDSQGISHFAKAGPFAASVPTRFGFDPSPPSSMPRLVGDSIAVRNLRSSAFGKEVGEKATLASSPPVAGPEMPNRRFMHSERFTSKPNMMSMSLGTRPPQRTAEEWEDNFAFEEDLVPDSLKELLTPQEKMRRLSRNADEELSNVGSRLSLSGLGSGGTTPHDGGSKVGSPLGASPSRFSGFFQRQKSENNLNSIENGNSISNFGHVGSPLRNSLLQEQTGLSSKRSSFGDMNTSMFIASPPRQASMSIISQQLQRTRLQNRAASEEALSQLAPQYQQHHPSSAAGLSRNLSANSILNTSTFGLPSASSSTTAAAPPLSHFDRTVSSSSMARSEKIDEEQEVFSMDGDGDGGVNDGEDAEEEDRSHNGLGRANHRINGLVSSAGLRSESWDNHHGGTGGGGIWGLGSNGSRMTPVGASSFGNGGFGGASGSLGRSVEGKGPWNS